MDSHCPSQEQHLQRSFYRIENGRCYCRSLPVICSPRLSKDFKRDTLNCSAPLSLLLMSGSVYAVLSGDRFTKNSSCYLNFIISIGTVDRWFSSFVSSHYPMDVLTKVWFIWSVIFRSCIFRAPGRGSSSFQIFCRVNLQGNIINVFSGLSPVFACWQYDTIQ